MSGMPGPDSSPCQSKLLRLAIAHYRQGLDRHRRAVRKTRYAVAMSVELGAALVLVPAAVVMQQARTAGRKLRQSVAKSQLLGLSSQTAEQPIAAILKAVGDCLSVGQVKLLLQMSEPPLVPGAMGRLALLAQPWGRLRGRRSVTNELGGGRVTGIASDLETRSLVLVLNCKVVWNGLSAEQQRQLQNQILLFLNGGAGGSFVRSTTISGAAVPVLQACAALVGCAVSKSMGLAYKMRSFWVEVLRVVANLRWRDQMGSVPQMAGGADKISAPRVPLNRLPFGSTLPASILTATKSTDLTPSTSALRSSNLTNALTLLDVDSRQFKANQCWEVKVETVGYVEHPLERLLKWVDGLLLWVEVQWQRLKDWRSKLKHLRQGGGIVSRSLLLVVTSVQLSQLLTYTNHS